MCHTGVGQCDDPTTSRNVPHCVSVARKCTDHDDTSVECLACIDGCSGRPGKPGVNNWCWYYHTNFPGVCADDLTPFVGDDCTADCLATSWSTVPLQIADPAAASADCTPSPGPPPARPPPPPPTSTACPQGCITVGSCPPPAPGMRPIPPPAPPIRPPSPDESTRLPAASLSSGPLLNYTGPANYTAISDCDETKSEIGMK